MKILLLNPPYRVKINRKYEKFFVRAGSRWPFSEYKKINEESLYRPFPFFLAYTAGVLKRNHFEVEVIDGVTLQCQMDEFLDLVLSKTPDVVLIEVTPFSIFYDNKIMKNFKMKNKDIIGICVGPFVPFVVDVLKENQFFDYIIFGEYEIATYKIILSLINNNKCQYKGVYSIKEIINVKNFEFTPLIEPLDILGHPLREIFPSNDHSDIDAYWDGFCQFKPSAQMHTSRGCPHRCYFCLWNQVMYRNGKYRTFSTKFVVDEIEYLVKRFHVKEIYIDDDDFTVDKLRVIEICKEILKRNIKVYWSCMGNAMNLDEETIYWMSKAGCIGIKFGVESGDEKISRTIGKPIDLKWIKYIVYLLNKYNIKSHATFTFGLLNETKISMVNTLKFAQDLKTSTVQFSICTPYPFTKFYNVLLKKGYLSNTKNLNLFDGSCECVYEYPHLSSKEIKLFYSKAYKKWLLKKCLSIDWILRWIRMVVKIFLYGGIKSKQALYVTFFRVIRNWL